MRKRRRSTLALALGATLASVGIAVPCQSPASIKPFEYCLLASYSCNDGRPEVAISGGFRPARLPKSRLAPIHLNVGGRIRTADGSHPPALEQMVVEVDRNATIDARGLAVCRPVPLAAGRTAVPDPCKGTRVGEGEMEFEVALPESAPFTAKSHVVAFNGGKRDGVTTVLVHGYLPSPVSSAVMIRVKVTKAHHGSYGTKLVAKIPPVASGAGSMTKFKLDFFREFTYRHKKRSYLLAKCPDGKLGARMEFSFREIPTVIAGAIVQPCTTRR